MQSVLENFTLRASADITAAEIALRGIPNDDPNGAFLPHVIAAIKNGTYKLSEIRLGEHIDGYTVYGFENFGEHRELISVATVSKCAVCIRHVMETLLVEIAEKENCRSIRMHTVRAGLIKEAINKDWHIAEVVLRKTLKPKSKK